MTHRAKIVSARFSQPVLIFLLAISCITSFSVTAQVIERNPFPWARNEKALLEQIAAYQIPSLPQDSIQTLGFWGWGMCGGVAAMGNYVFTASGPQLLWLDMSDKRHPVIVWDTLVPGILTNMMIQDSIGYALMARFQLLIVDFRNPLRPVILSRLQFPPWLYLDLVVDGTLAFVKRWYSYLYCIDVSDPSLPYIRSVIRNVSAQWGTLALSDHNLYMGDQNGFTEYVDVSNPDSASGIPLYNLAWFVTAAYIKDSLLLLGNNRLNLYSIATPDSPVQLSNIGNWGIRSITLQGDTAFVGTIDGYLVAVDITDRSNPTVLGTYIPPVFQPGLSAEYLAAQDTALYCAYGNGLTTFSISDPTLMSVLSFFPTGYENNKVIVRNGLAYVTSGYGGLWVVDVSDPTHPRRVGNIQTPGYAYDLVVDSTKAYLSVNHPRYFANEEVWNGIWALDISRPDSLRVLDVYTTGDPFAISKSGSLLFVAHGNYFAPPPDTTLTILDVSDPSEVRRVGGIVAGYYVYEITSRDSIAFVATGYYGSNPGLKIFDCRNPANPQLLSTTLTRAKGVSVNGNFAYVHRGDSSFVVDITDLSAPVILGKFRHPNPNWEGPWESIATNNLVFWANPGEFGIIDVSNPYEPFALFEPAWYGGGGLYLVDDTIFVTSRSTGLAILRHKWGTTFVQTELNPIPQTVNLYSNYPNPFNASTVIHYQLPGTSYVTLRVFNILGQEVATLVNEEKKAGNYTVMFDASNLPSGIYFCRLSAQEKSLNRKMVILK